MAPNLAAIAEDLCVRSRAGDQNARALIVETKKAADSGSVQAKKALRAINEYIAKNPVKDVKAQSTIGADEIHALSILREYPSSAAECLAACFSELALLTAICIMCDGPRIDPSRVRAPSEKEASAVVFGYESYSPITVNFLNVPEPDLVPWSRSGSLLGRAAAIQAVRAGAPIRLMSPGAAWELGE
jgi:hypothetical protein